MKWLCRPTRAFDSLAQFRSSFIIHDSSCRPAAALTAILLAALQLGCGMTAGGGTLDVNLQSASGKVTVRILDATTHQPVNGAVVSIFDSAGRQVGPWMTTGENGSVTFTGLAPGGDYRAHARVLGQYAEGISDRSLQVDGVSQVQATVELEPQKGNLGTLTGAIQDANTRDPIEGARAVMDSKAATGIVTGNDGLFVFKNVALGSHVVTITKQDYTPFSFKITVKDVGVVTSLGESLRLTPVRQFGIGDTLIADLGNDRVIQVSRGGGTLWTSTSVSRPSSATRLASGATAIASSGDNKVLELSASRTLLWSFGSSLLGFPGKLKDPQSVAAAKDGRLLIADQGHNQVVELAAAGQQIIRTFAAGLSEPRSAIYLDNGNILVADSGHAQVVELSPAGQRVWAYSDTLVKPTYAQRLANGNTLITDMGSNAIVEVRDNHTLVSSFSTGLRYPRAASRLAGGNTLVTDSGNNRVVEFSSSWEEVWSYQNLSQPMSAERLTTSSAATSSGSTGQTNSSAANSGLPIPTLPGVTY